MLPETPAPKFPNGECRVYLKNIIREKLLSLLKPQRASSQVSTLDLSKILSDPSWGTPGAS